jgi:uncharacterized protein
MRAITWIKERGAEFAEVSLGGTYLRAAGVAVSGDPLPYRMSYELDCAEGFVTRGLIVSAHGANWSRRLVLARDPQGVWSVEASADGEVDLPAPGGDPAAFAAALDCDLGECPLTNTMPVLRHGLLRGGAPREFVMAWVGVPSLTVTPSEQKYTFVGPPPNGTGATAGAAVIRYQSGTFSADVVFDEDGLVIDYPGLGRQA